MVNGACGCAATRAVTHHFLPIPELRDRLTMLVIVGTRTEQHFLRSHVGIGSESACLFGQLRSNFDISDSDAGLKEEN